MRFESNLRVDDLSGFFVHMESSPMGHSFGHDVPRDWKDKDPADPEWAVWKQSGSWTRDELAILAAWASQTHRFDGMWVDIGCNTGMVSKYINWYTNSPVMCVDPVFGHSDFVRRFQENTGFPKSWQFNMTSEEFWRINFPELFLGIVIDGDHDRPGPLLDARGADAMLQPHGVILFHDFMGEPVQEAVTELLNHDYSAHIYFTPHMVAACWMGIHSPRNPPIKHTPDPNLPDLRARCPNFDWSRVSHDMKGEALKHV